MTSLYPSLRRAAAVAGSAEAEPDDLVGGVVKLPRISAAARVEDRAEPKKRDDRWVVVCPRREEQA